MSPLKASAVLLASLAWIPAVLAHGHAQFISVNGNPFPNGEADDGYRWPPHTDNFASPQETGPALNHPDMICGFDARPAPSNVKVPVGASVKMHWNYFSQDRSHPGPIITYLAACNGPCATVDKTKLEFVKVAAEGLIAPNYNFPGESDRSMWATDRVRDTDKTYTFTVPADFAPGEYVLRHEFIALQFDEKQFYPNCFNLEITGSGTARPKGTRGTELYRMDMPGIAPEFYPFKPIDTYPMPGPPLYRDGVFITENMDYYDNVTPPPSSSPPAAEEEDVAVNAAAGASSARASSSKTTTSATGTASASASSSSTKSTTLSTTTRPSATAAPVEGETCDSPSTTTVVVTVTATPTSSPAAAEEEEPETDEYRRLAKRQAMRHARRRAHQN